MTEKAIEVEEAPVEPAPTYHLTYIWTRAGSSSPLTATATTERHPREVVDELTMAQAENKMLELRARNSWIVLSARDVISLEIKPTQFGTVMP